MAKMTGPPIISIHQRKKAGEDIRDLLKALKTMDKALRPAARKKLREVGEIVAAEARTQAESQGLRKSGRLIRQIRPRLGRMSIQVAATATKKSPAFPRGFSYPALHEYGPNKRPFMRPALTAKRVEAFDKFAEVLDELEKEWRK